MPNFRLGDPPAPLYTPDLLGGLCETCGKPIPAALEDSTHPTCDPDWPALAMSLRRALARRKARG